jgi:hypothetical protein
MYRILFSKILSIAVVSAFILVPAAAAQDQNSLRATKAAAGDVMLVWSDASPGAFCLRRGEEPGSMTFLDSTNDLFYLDTPPAAPLWFYLVLEQSGGDCMFTRSTEEVCSRWKRDYPELSTDVWDGQMTGCDEGNVDPVAIEDAVRRTNLYRWLLGLPPIAENPTYSSKVQAAVVILRGLGALTHNPQPGDPCYTADGAEGAGNSNLSLNGGTLADAVERYIEDFGVPSLGHRRWLFFPPYAEGGFGYVEGGGIWSGQWVFGWGPDPSPAFVAYPSPGPFPIEGLRGPWSFSVDGGDFSAATVEVTRVSDGTPMTVTNVYEAAPNYGLNTLAWVVAGIAAGQEYEVFINEVNSTPMRSYTYVTHLVSCQ